MNVSASQAPVGQSTQRPTRIQQTEQKAELQTREQAPDAKKSPPAQPPTPVVNTQGQTTGRLLNVTA